MSPAEERAKIVAYVKAESEGRVGLVVQGGQCPSQAALGRPLPVLGLGARVATGSLLPVAPSASEALSDGLDRDGSAAKALPRERPTETVRQDMSADPHKAKTNDRDAAASGCSDLARSDYIDTIERTFAAVSDLYAKYWGEFFHFALFEKEDEDWEVAFHRTHQQYLDALRIERATKVLDLACGRGGFTDILAQSTEGSVLGIDISRSQLSHCRRFKRPNLHFRRHDIMKIDELGETFDAIALLDADCYLPDKELAIQKIASVMRPGCRLLMLSWCKKEGLNQIQEELVLHPFMKYWGIQSLATEREYTSHFAKSSLKVLDVTGLNERVGRNWEFGYEQAVQGIKNFSAGSALRLLWKGFELGPNGLRLIKEQFPAAVYIKVGFDTGFLQYMYFLVEKELR